MIGSLLPAQFARDARRRKAARQRQRAALLRLHLAGPAGALGRQTPVSRRADCLATILLGVALEFGQELVPGRAFEIRDMFINGFGVLTGIAIGIPSRRIVPAVTRS